MHVKLNVWTSHFVMAGEQYSLKRILFKLRLKGLKSVLAAEFASLNEYFFSLRHVSHNCKCSLICRSDICMTCDVSAMPWLLCVLSMLSCSPTVCVHRETATCLGAAYLPVRLMQIGLTIWKAKSLSVWQIPPFVFPNELTITLPLIFTQNYCTFLKPTLGGMHTYTHLHPTSARRTTLIHMYDPLKRSGASGSDRLPLNRSITFTPNDNDIIRPFICGVIHVASNSLCGFPAIAFLIDSCPSH